MSLTAVLKHIRVLDESGLVVRTKQGRVVTCSLRPDGFRQVAEFVDDYRSFWDGALDRMTDLLETPEERDAPV
jgi:DNA-binding transcriptional ArsR family regulator